jgi:hypothetical protein
LSVLAIFRQRYEPESCSDRRCSSLSASAYQTNSSYNSDQEDQNVEYPETDNQRRLGLEPMSVQSNCSFPCSHAELDSQWATDDPDKQNSDETNPNTISEPPGDSLG